MPVEAPVLGLLHEEPLEPRHDVGRGPVRGDEKVLRLELAARLGGVRRAALVVDQLGDGVGEAGRWVGDGRPPDRVDVEHPVVGVGQQGVVQVAGQRVQLLRGRGADVGPAIAPARDEGAILFEHHAVGDQEAPVQEVGEAGGLGAVLAPARQPARRSHATRAPQGERHQVHVTPPGGSRRERVATRRARLRAAGRSPGSRGCARTGRSCARRAWRPTP